MVNPIILLQVLAFDLLLVQMKPTTGRATTSSREGLWCFGDTSDGRAVDLHGLAAWARDLAGAGTDLVSRYRRVERSTFRTCFGMLGCAG